jgi:hypothetical protein
MNNNSALTQIFGKSYVPMPAHCVMVPPNVIIKIKQNSSDMNEIILAPCDAGYVQSCTGYWLERAALQPLYSGYFL